MKVKIYVQPKVATYSSLLPKWTTLIVAIVILSFNNISCGIMYEYRN